MLVLALVKLGWETTTRFLFTNSPVNLFERRPRLYSLPFNPVAQSTRYHEGFEITRNKSYHSLAKYNGVLEVSEHDLQEL